jgi:isopentenyl-diphosphate delta-isomerase
LNNAHRVVSSETEELILVDNDDNETGYLSKADCHDGEGVLHRAFSLFLFNDDGELLLQQRSASKRLWPGYWSNSVCSHPRRGESMQVATQRRLYDELNIESELEFVYKFAYRAGFDAAGSEHELCHVFLGRAPAEVFPNDLEIADIRFISTADLDREFADKPGTLTPWFALEWEALCTRFGAILSRYTVPV